MVLSALLALLLSVLVARSPLRPSALTMVVSSRRTQMPQMWVRGAAPSCRRLESPADDTPMRFCEDARVLPKLGIALFSCDPGRLAWNVVMGPLIDPKPRGALFVHAYTQPGAQPERLQIEGFPPARSFHPLGVAVWPESKLRARVFVVNHAERATGIEVIDLRRAGVGERWYARYVRTLQHPLATHAANSIAPLSKHAFVVTNTHTVLRRPTPAPQFAETLAGLYGSLVSRLLTPVLAHPAAGRYLSSLDETLALGFVSYVRFDDEPADTEEAPRRAEAEDRAFRAGVDAWPLLRGLAFPNGVGFAPGLQNLVVASTIYPGVALFPVQRWRSDDVPDWAHPEVFGTPQRIATPFFADNLVVLPPGQRSGAADPRVLPDDPLMGASVLVTGHPSLPDLTDMIANKADAAHGAGSWAVEIRYTGRTVPDDAPFPVQASAPAPPHGWSVRTVLQSSGMGPGLSLASGTALVYGDGQAIATGLYATPVQCTAVDLDA